MCGTDVAFRIICAGDAPDHTVLARFRQRHEAALGDLLAQTLLLCAQLGMVRLGVVALDGTKIAANAARARILCRRLCIMMLRAYLSCVTVRSISSEDSMTFEFIS